MQNMMGEVIFIMIGALAGSVVITVNMVVVFMAIRIIISEIRRLRAMYRVHRARVEMHKRDYELKHKLRAMKRQRLNQKEREAKDLAFFAEIEDIRNGS